MKKINSIRYKCENCGNDFCIPSLGDFSYGEFILSSPNEFRYLNALEDIVFDELDALIEEMNLDKEVDVQHVFGPLTCDPDLFEEKFSIVKSTYCRYCGSTNLKVINEEKQSFLLVQKVSHNNWNRLEKDEKVRLFNNYFN